jgi:transposase
MGQPIAVRTDFSAVEVRRLARRAKDSDQVRRLLAIAAVIDGASRAVAAKVGGMDRQTLRDWVIRFNEQGPDGLINVPAPGAPAKLNKRHRAFLARIVDEGPIPAVHGVVRWRACDLIMRLHDLKKLPRSRGGNPQQPRAGHAGRGVVQDEMRVGQKNKLTYRWAPVGSSQ